MALEISQDTLLTASQRKIIADAQKLRPQAAQNIRAGPDRVDDKTDFYFQNSVASDSILEVAEETRTKGMFTSSELQAQDGSNGSQMLVD